MFMVLKRRASQLQFVASKRTHPRNRRDEGAWEYLFFVCTIVWERRRENGYLSEARHREEVEDERAERSTEVNVFLQDRILQGQNNKEYSYSPPPSPPSLQHPQNRRQISYSSSMYEYADSTIQASKFVPFSFFRLSSS